MIKLNLTLIIAISLMLFSCGSSSKMKVSESGYVYEIVKKNNGAKLIEGDFAYFNAEVTSLEGDFVYSSQESGKPAIIKLVKPPEGERPNPFAEILIGASVGDSIHIHLGKEESGGSGYDSLLYKVGIFDTVNEADYQKKIQEENAKLEAEKTIVKALEPEVATKVAAYYSKIKAGGFDSEIQTTDSGLKYIFHEKGNGPLIENGKPADVHYYGVLSRTGEMFDNSWKRGTAFSFPLGEGRVIKGWDEGVALLPRGSKATLIIPGELGYGERGSGKIEANDELIFYIEVQE